MLVITVVAVIVGEGSPTATGFGLIPRVVVVPVGAADALVAANAATMASAEKLMSNDFLRAEVLRKVVGNWTSVVVTDGVEPDDRIAKTF